MKYCSKCNNYVQDEAVACPTCGETYLYIVNPDGTLAYPQQPNAYPQQPNAYTQQPNAYTQQPNAYPQQNQAAYNPPAAPTEPKKKNNKMMIIIAAVVAILVLVLVFVFMGSGDKDDKTTTSASVETTVTGDTASDVTETVTENQPSSIPDDDKSDSDVMVDGMKVNKIGEIKYNSVYTDSSSALTYYDDNDKYGIITLDGKNDTGAKYTVCDTIGDYFQVMTVEKNSIVDAASLNCVGLVDKFGNEIIPCKYAAINDINERFFRVCEVTEQTTNKDEALVYYTDKIFSLSASDDDILFKGRWYIYDVVAGRMLEGISGTNAYSMSAYGDFVTYYTDSQEEITVSANGTRISDDATLFSNGIYKIENDDESGAVYDANGKLFDFSADDFIPSDGQDDYILASKYINDKRVYVYLNFDGEIVSAQFDSYPSVYSNLICADSKIYNFKGENIIDGTFSSVYYEEQFGDLWFLKNDKTYTLINKDGTVIWTGTADDTMNVDVYSYFTVSKKTDDKKMIYSYADKDYTIEGSEFAPLLATAYQPDYSCSLIDVVTGKTLLRDYDGYSYVEIPGSVMYIYAEKEDGGIDIYTIK